VSEDTIDWLLEPDTSVLAEIEEVERINRRSEAEE
jgi:hypothetical protein